MALKPLKFVYSKIAEDEAKPTPVRLTPSMIAALDAIADLHTRSRHQIMIAALDEFIQRAVDDGTIDAPEKLKKKK